jgi:cell division control protein 6
MTQAVTGEVTTVNGLAIFLEKGVFDECYLPKRVLHRDDQIRRVEGILADAEKGSRPKNTLATGAFGSGKTLVVRTVCASLPPGCIFVYVSCSRYNTRLKIMREALRQLRVSTPESGVPSDYYDRRFDEAVSSHRFVILALDEVDKFTERKGSESFELFYMLSRLVSNVTTILLTNRTTFEVNFVESMDSRVRDTFRWTPIDFPDYDSEELTDIVEDRCRVGLNVGTYDRGICGLVAALAYTQGGRARGALILIQKAAEIAESNHHAKLEEADVRDAAKQLKETQGSDLIRRLPPPQRAILAFILANSPTSPAGEAWWADWAPKHDLGSARPTFQRYVKELETLALVNRTIRGFGRGRGKVAILTVPPELVATVTYSLAIQDESPATPLSTMDTVTKDTDLPAGGAAGS